jgi:hypothetical protein
MPNLRVAYLPGRVREEWQLTSEQARSGNVAVAGQSSHRDVAALVADVAELGEPADIDKDLGHRQAQLHEREQRVPASEKLRVLAAFRGQA